MNKLVPYLDLFGRLDDAELARLAEVDAEVCTTLRGQVDAINAGLAPYADLLPRLCDAELVRLTGASDRTIRFWRLCQPREVVPSHTVEAAAAPTAPPARPAEPEQPDTEVASPAELRGVPSTADRIPTAPHGVIDQPIAESSGSYPEVAEAAPGRTGPESGYITLSGAPFPGFDHDDSEDVALEEVEDGPDPLGLNQS